MTCATDPVLWAPQQRLPPPVMQFLRVRLEQALAIPAARLHLVWPLVLGSPKVRDAWPNGIPLPDLFAQAGRMLASIGAKDPERCWLEALEAFPDTADQGNTGWVPHRIWEPLASLVSLRCGLILLALTGQPEDTRYRLASAVTLFNSALFHECHDALESLWLRSSGDLKRGLQGLILLTAGFFHQQHGDARGMLALWEDALDAMEAHGSMLATPWGTVDFSQSLEVAAQRLAWIQSCESDEDLGPLWRMPRPEWEWKG